MKDLFSFFTRIPIRGDLVRASKQVYLLNLLGFIISLVPFAVYQLTFRFLPRELTPLIVLISIFSITGLIHIDGLSDLADGIVKKGDKESKIKALKDVNTGVAGTMFVLFDLLGIYLAIYTFHGSFLDSLAFFSISEISAKTSMLSGIAFFKAPDLGLSHIFKSNYKSWYFPIGIMTILPFFILFSWSILISLSGILIGLLVGLISVRNFGFVNGDAIGAMNEISRVTTMWILCIIL